MWAETKPDRRGMISLVVTLLVFFVIGALIIKYTWPAPSEPTVTVSHWTTGHLTRDGLLVEMAKNFNKEGHRTASGEKIVVQVYNVPSELIGKYLIELLRS